MSTAPDAARAHWVASSHSGNGGGNCVEWAPEYASATGVVPVRDSKVADGPTLTVTAAAFTAFVRGVKHTGL
ncbi:DUF397 domain-containing protein [Streptomyces sp. JNUCC 64]